MSNDWDRYILCRDIREDCSMLLLSNFYVKANGLQTEETKCR